MKIFFRFRFVWSCLFVQLFNKFDNGNGRLSLAEIDRAIISFYPQFGTNKRVIMRAYKAADTNEVWGEQ